MFKVGNKVFNSFILACLISLTSCAPAYATKLHYTSCTNLHIMEITYCETHKIDMGNSVSYISCILLGQPAIESALSSSQYIKEWWCEA